MDWLTGMPSKNMAIVIVIAIVIVAGASWLGLQKDSVGTEQEGIEAPPASSELAPDVALTDYDGKAVRLSDFSGKALVVNAWAAWCPFCVKELNDFVAVQKEFGDRVVIIAIDRAESRDTAKQFTDGLGISNDLVFLLDPDDSFYTAIGGFAMPETIFVKADGIIHFHKRGPMPVEEIRQRVNELVQ